MSISSSINVLIVEDDVMVQRIISEFLKKVEGFTLIGSVGDLKSAKRFIQHNQVDLILLDVYLPDGLGTDLLKWVVHDNLKLNVILITADNHSDTLELALRHGVVDYLVKPFRMERFIEALTNFQKNREILVKNQSVDQSDIDLMFKGKASDQGYINQTSEMILQYLKAQAPSSYTSTEIAKSVGISRITARKYLENMELSGEIILELSYGGVGRPKNKYRVEN